MWWEWGREGSPKFNIYYSTMWGEGPEKDQRKRKRGPKCNFLVWDVWARGSSSAHTWCPYYLPPWYSSTPAPSGWGRKVNKPWTEWANKLVRIWSIRWIPQPNHPTSVCPINLCPPPPTYSGGAISHIISPRLQDSLSPLNALSLIPLP